MSSNYHTPLSVGDPANADTFNHPMGDLDQAISNLHGGANVTADTLKAWTEGECYELTSVSYDADGVITSGTVKWPDGSGGTLTATTINSTVKAIDAFTITHTASGKTVTQNAVTRDASSGQITVKPALTVA